MSCGPPRRLFRFTSSGQGGSGPSATQARVKAIYAICESQGLSQDVFTGSRDGVEYGSITQDDELPWALVSL